LFRYFDWPSEQVGSEAQLRIGWAEWALGSFRARDATRYEHRE
jgi:hypothetical protein